MKITIENPKIKFYQHLSRPNNFRILFSAKFGTGKSFFLKDYFNGESDKYNVFLISPINYVIGANHDIFEWIKIDIAKELITKHLPPKREEKFSKNLLIQFYLYKNAGTLFSKLASTLVEDYVGKTTLPFLKSFKNDIVKYKEFEKKTNEEVKPEGEKLLTYLNSAFQVRGSIYEDDVTTQILRAALETLKLTSKKENVLIIDDLDRLDPEHIFRILNILSAHNDHFDSNKFGFDKVILCCDLDNIESIYKYRYGQQVDFEGYIEKFYTYEPFLFSNKDSVISFCQDELLLFDLDESTRNVLSLLLVCLLKYEKLKIRNLKKLHVIAKSELELSNPLRKYDAEISDDPNVHLRIDNTITDTKFIDINFNKFGIIKGLYLISIALGGIDNLKRALIELKQMSLESDSFDTKFLPHIFNSICLLSHISTNLSNNIPSAFFLLNKLSGDARFKVLII